MYHHFSPEEDMNLLRRVGLLACSVALAVAGTGVAAGSAFANTTEPFCVWIESDQAQYVCALNTPVGQDVKVGLELSSILTISNYSGAWTHIAIPEAGNICMQAFADAAFNGGWSVRFEKCEHESGQYWAAVAGPVVQGKRVYYWENEYDPAYCLAWDRDAGELFTDTCRNAWYQQFHF
jgi:hypothetical protein